ncbi:MAG: ATP synthase F0 subunit B [Desulfobacterales bacterium]|nr:ATP synthase F0 subunit B [Desulfobacterales bacterium]
MSISVVGRKVWKGFLPWLGAFLLFLPGVAFGSGDSGSSISVIPDGSVVIQIVNFLFLIWVLNMLLFRPIRGILVKRSEKVDGLEKQIETFQSDAVKQEGDYALGIKEARAKGVKGKEALMNAAAEDERKAVAKITERAQADLAVVKKKIATEVDGVRTSLLKEVDGFAKDITQKILGRAV